jgi:hypothetical protein
MIHAAAKRREPSDDGTVAAVGDLDMIAVLDLEEGVVVEPSGVELKRRAAGTTGDLDALLILGAAVGGCRAGASKRRGPCR